MIKRLMLFVVCCLILNLFLGCSKPTAVSGEITKLEWEWTRCFKKLKEFKGEGWTKPANAKLIRKILKVKSQKKIKNGFKTVNGKKVQKYKKIPNKQYYYYYIVKRWTENGCYSARDYDQKPRWHVMAHRPINLLNEKFRDDKAYRALHVITSGSEEKKYWIRIPKHQWNDFWESFHTGSGEIPFNAMKSTFGLSKIVYEK